MNSTTNSERIDSNDPVAAILQACAQIGHTDEQPRLEQARPHLSDQRKRPAFRAANYALPRRWGRIGLLLAGCIYVAAAAWSSYDAAKPFITPWVSTRASISSLFPVDRPSADLRPDTIGAMSRPEPLAETTSQVVPPDAPPIPPHLAKVLETIARDIANLQQSIEQLKISQEQVARDHASVVEQLKASHEQISRDIAKVGQQLAGQEQITQVLAKAVEQSMRPKPLAPPRPTITPIRKPVLTPASSQARAQQLLRSPDNGSR